MLLAAILVVLLLIGWFSYEHWRYITSDNAQIDAHTILIGSKVGGYIQEVNVLIGQAVKKNDIMVLIDQRDYKVAKDVAQSDLLSLEAKRKDSEKNFQRVRDLFAKGVVSNQQYDTASAAYNENKAKYDSAMAHLQQAQLNLEYTELRAPMDGIIARKSVEVGQLAAPGMALIGFVGSESRWVIANLKETEIAHIKPGQKVEIDVDAVPSRTFHGTVESISSATGATFSLLPPDNATGNFTKVVQRVPVKIVFDDLNQDEINRLQAGLSAFVKIKIR